MSKILRSILIVIAGIVVGSVVNMTIVSVGPMVIPLPEGVDMSDAEKFADNLKQLKPVNFIAPWLAHALGTFTGAFVAAKLATDNKMTLAMSVGAFFLLGGIMMVSMFGGPIWFAILDIVGAYLPVAYLSAKLAKTKKVATVS